jgi:hypothetical protein
MPTNEMIFHFAPSFLEPLGDADAKFLAEKTTLAGYP